MNMRVVVTLISLVGCASALMLSIFQCCAADVGSDTAVARFSTQQTLDDGDRIAGFAAIENGFALKGAFVTGTFDSLFPITGRMDLNGGTLILDKNLYLDHVSEWEMLGNVTGQNRLIHVGASVASISSLTDDVYQCRLYSIAETAHGDTIEAVDWSWDSQYVAVASDVVSTTSALAVYKFDGTNLTRVQTDILEGAQVRANEVCWHPSQYILGVVRDASAGGDEVLTYSFVPETAQLVKLSSDEFGDRVNAVAWHPSGDYLAVGGLSNSAEIAVYPVDADGVLDTAGRLVKNIPGGAMNVRSEALDWDTTGNYLAAGFNNAPQLQVFAFGTSPLSLTLNASVTIGNVVDGLDWNPTYSWILSIGITGVADDFEIYAHDNVAGTLTKMTSDALGGAAKSTDWHPDGDCLATGKAKVSGIAKLNTYKFDNSVPSLTLSTNINFAQTVGAVRWSPNGMYLAKGSGVDLAVYGLIRDHCSVLDDVNILLNGDVTLKNCCLYFKGNCSIDGGDHELTLEQSSLMMVTNNSTLHLKNITINGLKTTTLKMGASGSRLLFENVKVRLGRQLLIDKGCFDVLGTFHLTGNDSLFIYSSDQISTIGSKSELILDEEITFSYDAPAPNLLQFADNTGKIVLAGATLHATSAGLELTTGRMDVIENSFLSSEVLQGSETIIDNGISFGAAAPGTNCKIKLFPNTCLHCVSGSIKYKNIGSNQLEILNHLSHIHFYTGTTLWLYTNIDIRPGFIEFDDQARLMSASGKKITGSIIPRGTLLRGRFTP